MSNDFRRKECESNEGEIPVHLCSPHNFNVSATLEICEVDNCNGNDS